MFCVVAYFHNYSFIFVFHLVFNPQWEIIPLQWSCSILFWYISNMVFMNTRIQAPHLNLFLSDTNIVHFYFGFQGWRTHIMLKEV